MRFTDYGQTRGLIEKEERRAFVVLEEGAEDAFEKIGIEIAEYYETRAKL
jgi:hypothetical protein